MAKRRKSRMFAGVPVMKIATYGAGAGISGLAGSQLTKVGVPTNLAEPVAGLLMVVFGRKLHPIVRDLGMGILIKEVGDFVEKAVGGITVTGNSSWTW